jgi:leucyl-tRNA synthetase
VVICPEHPKALEIAANEYAQQTKEYIANARNKSELERTAFTKEKTGVFTGRYVVNPVTEEKVPVWIADYVLATTGTGAVMGVPAGDERDMQFAQKFGLPVVKYEDYQGEVGEEFVTYHLRDWLVSRQRYWGAPIPMVCCESCGWNPVPEDQLPVLLPTDVDFLPTGESPIASSKTFQEGVTCPKCGKPARREVDTMDTFVDSSWYFLRFCDPKNINMAWDKERAAEWMPVDMYVGGAEHTVLHLLYSRFFYMVFCDLGLVDKTLGDEPFLKLRHQGTILGEDGRKMSKRWGNVINPDDVGKKFGADTLKMYELFMGPFEATKPWSTFGVEGVARFLGRVERLFDKTYGKSKSESQELERQVGLMVDKVGRDIENLSFNTAIAKMMETLNLMVSEGEIGNHVWEKYILVLEPFAPMLANKLWQKMGKGTDVASESWPEVDIDKLRASSVKVAIQVNGKLRKVIEVAVAESNNEVELLRLAMQDERVAIHVKDKKIKKVFVPGKILNLVTS